MANATSTTNTIPWEGLFHTNERPTSTENRHCQKCLAMRYSEFSGCRGPEHCGIYEDVYCNWLNEPERKARREEAERIKREEAEKRRRLERQLKFDEASEAYNRGEGFISFGPFGGSFTYNGMTWSYDDVRHRAYQIR